MVAPLSDPVEALILDLLEWLEAAPRPYVEVMEAWRTSCPRLPVWEEASDRGFVLRQGPTQEGVLVAVSAPGRTHLRQYRATGTATT
jgi:D-3-phosphoglycerate dehydrogenase